MRSALQPPLQSARLAIDKALALADHELLGAATPSLSAQAYFDEFSQAIDGVFAVNGTAMGALDLALNDKATTLQQRQWLVVAGLVLGALVALCLGMAFVRSVTVPVNDAVRVAQAVANGQLHGPVSVRGNNELGALMQALSDMRQQLQTLVSAVHDGADSVATASTEIASGNLDLAARTESQASALEETAASMEELSGTVRQNADGASQAYQLAITAQDMAARGAEVVDQVVCTMQNINESSHEISDITGLIDGIAFQTNILALNAAVEAARAGDQGRGFAVVATEVRLLASRSSAAARDIKALIEASVARVESGTVLVAEAGKAMANIASSIHRVTEIMAGISHAIREQSLGMAQVGDALALIDQATQQNAALVEQVSAAAGGLRARAQDLVRTVSVFELSEDTPLLPINEPTAGPAYSTVTDFAKLRGLSTSVPRAQAV